MEIQHQEMTAEQAQLMESEIEKQQQLHVERKSDMKETMLELYPKLLKPFPKEAHKALPGGAGLTTIKAHYVIERLNETFGIDGWRYERKSLERIDTEVVVEGVLVILNSENNGVLLMRHSCGGGQKRKGSWGDAYKSADTDAISKAASHIGIGNDVFKGLVDANGNLKTASALNGSKPPAKGFSGGVTQTKSAPVDI